MTPEGVVKQRVKDLLKRYNILNAKDAHLATSDHDGWYHMPGQGGYGVVGGIPDFLGHYGGRLFGLKTLSLSSPKEACAFPSAEPWVFLASIIIFCCYNQTNRFFDLFSFSS